MVNKKLMSKNSKKLNKILNKYDKLAAKIPRVFVYGSKEESAESKATREYLENNLNTIKELAKNADLDKIHFKGKRYIKLNRFGSPEDMYDFEIKYKKAQSPLMWAIRRDKPELLQYFIDCGANVNMSFEERNAPFSSYIGPRDTALNYGRKETVEILINAGAEFNDYQIDRLIEDGLLDPVKEKEKAENNKLNREKQAKEQAENMEANIEREV